MGGRARRIEPSNRVSLPSAHNGDGESVIDDSGSRLLRVLAGFEQDNVRGLENAIVGDGLAD